MGRTDRQMGRHLGAGIRGINFLENCLFFSTGRKDDGENDDDDEQQQGNRNSEKDRNPFDFRFALLYAEEMVPLDLV